MKKYLKSLLLVCVVMLASINVALAQQPNANQAHPNKKPRPNMEQFTKMQAQRIAQTLALDENTSKKFVETFCNCRKEMGATRVHPQGRKKRSEMTDAEVDKAIKADFQQGRKLLAIREKYYKAYSKFLSPKQIQRVYDLERQDMRHFAKRGPK